LLFVVGLVAFSLAVCVSWPAHSQVGKGLIDLNSAPEKELAALPHLTPAIVKGIIDKRPFATIVEANGYLTAQPLTPAQVADLYRRAFVHVNLNWVQIGSKTAQTPGKTRVWQIPEGKASQQHRFPCEICKTSIPGSNPGGASKNPKKSERFSR
jgi:hypothetical protein